MAKAKGVRTEAAVVRAAMGRPWGLLAHWIDLKFPGDNDPEIQQDLRALDAACKRHAAAVRGKRGR